MEELIYSIDKTRSDQDEALVIKIQVAKRSGLSFDPIENQPLLTQDRLQKMATSKDLALLPFLIAEEKNFLGGTIDKQKTSLQYIHISTTSVATALNLFASTGKLFYHSKALTVDLYSKVEFYYAVDTSSVSGYLKSGGQAFDVAACDFIGKGTPNFFVKGIVLKCVPSTLSWKDFKAAFEKKIKPIQELLEDAKEDNEAPRVVMLEGATIHKEPEPLPVLMLVDRLGSFANLAMDYGNNVLVSCHEPQTNVPRQLNVEAGWEKDLLETNFIKKPVGSSQYYCPLDKVAKSIAFLLEIGWQVRDWRGNKVLLQSDISLQAEASAQTLSIKGKVRYDTFDANLTDIVGAFNRRERFAEIAPGHVALLPNSWEQSGIDVLTEEGEIVGDTLQMKKNRIGALASLFETQPQMKLDQSLETIKEKLKTFEGVQQTDPGMHFVGALRPYQQQGLSWLSFLHQFGFHGILADDMGLGKTVQVIAFLSTLTLQHPVLIVVPTSLVFNWKNELQRFLSTIPVTIHHGSHRGTTSTTLDRPQIILTTYTTLRLDFDLFNTLFYDCLILDEAQAIKNAHTQTSQAVSKLNAQFRLSITGTPIENHLMELWAHFRFLMPDLFGNEKSFQAEVQAGMSDPRFLRRIQRRIRPFFLRRRKEEVAKDLPEKIEQVVWVEMGDKQRSAYEAFLSGIRKNLLVKVSADGAAKHRMEIFESIMRLRQICCHPMLIGNEEAESAKLDLLMQDLETAIAEERKVLVYSQFTSMLALIGKRVKEAGWQSVYLDGSTRDREKVVAEFQNNKEISLFLISLKAGGIGLNLTAADYVFLYDPWWNNAIENQAIDRAHRIGRKDTVIAKRYVMAESIEEKIMKLKAAKTALANELFDDERVVQELSADELLTLFD